MTWREEELHYILGCKTPTQLFGVLRDEAARLGMGNVAIGLVLPVPLDQKKFVLFNDYSPEWKERYADNNFLAIDPTVLLNQYGIGMVHAQCSALAEANSSFPITSCERSCLKWPGSPSWRIARLRVWSSIRRSQKQKYSYQRGKKKFFAELLLGYLRLRSQKS